MLHEWHICHVPLSLISCICYMTMQTTSFNNSQLLLKTTDMNHFHHLLQERFQAVSLFPPLAHFAVVSGLNPNSFSAVSDDPNLTILVTCKYQ